MIKAVAQYPIKAQVLSFIINLNQNHCRSLYRFRSAFCFSVNFISKLKKYQTYCEYFFKTSCLKFTRNARGVQATQLIPPHGVSRRDMPCLSADNCVYYHVETRRVLTQTLLGFYRYSNLGGYGYSQEPTHLCVSDYPLDFKKELL